MFSGKVKYFDCKKNKDNTVLTFKDYNADQWHDLLTFVKHVKKHSGLWYYMTN